MRQPSTTAASLFTKQEDYDQAISDYSQALKLDPDFTAALFNMACVYSLLHDETQACEWLERAIQKDNELASMAQTDADFDPIRDGEQFRALLARYASPEQL